MSVRVLFIFPATFFWCITSTSCQWYMSRHPCISYKHNEDQFIKTLLHRVPSGQKLHSIDKPVLSLKLRYPYWMHTGISTWFSVYLQYTLCLNVWDSCQALWLVQSLFGPQGLEPCLPADLHLSSTAVAATLHPSLFFFSWLLLTNFLAFSWLPLLLYVLFGRFSILIVFHSFHLSSLVFMLITCLDFPTLIISPYWLISSFLRFCSALFCFLAILCNPCIVSVYYCSF